MSPVHFQFRRLIAVIGWVALVGACAPGGEETDTPRLDTAERGGAATTSSPAPDHDTGGTGDEAFPIPTPEGGAVVTDEWNGTTGHITIRYPADRYQEIVAFYDEYASGSGWNRSEVGRGDVPTVNQMHLMRGLNISIDPPTGEHMIVTLTIS